MLWWTPNPKHNQRTHNLKEWAPKKKDISLKDQEEVLLEYLRNLINSEINGGLSVYNKLERNLKD